MMNNFSEVKLHEEKKIDYHAHTRTDIRQREDKKHILKSVSSQKFDECEWEKRVIYLMKMMMMKMVRR